MAFLRSAGGVASSAASKAMLDLPEEALEEISRIRKRCEEMESEVASLKHSVKTILAMQQPQSSAVEKFNSLVAEWKSTRGHAGTDLRLAMHPAYQAIVGMGAAVVPLLLKEMEQHPSHWTWALRAITQVDPVPKESRGKLKEIAQAWVKWDKENGYTW